MQVHMGREQKAITIYRIRHAAGQRLHPLPDRDRDLHESFVFLILLSYAW
jgi:hypothetical protein